MITKNLLVPVDFSDASFPVIQKAGELAHELPARVVLLHVVEPVAASFSLDSASLVFAASRPLETPKSISALQFRLDTLADPLKAEGIEVHSVAVVDLVVDDILEQSVKLGADYIVLGCHGHLANHDLFTGNVCLGLLKRQPACPMIVVPVEDPSKSYRADGKSPRNPTGSGKTPEPPAVSRGIVGRAVWRIPRLGYEPSLLRPHPLP